MASSVDPAQTAPIGAVCSVFTLFASILNLTVMLGNYLQQMTSADHIFRWVFFLAFLGLKLCTAEPRLSLLKCQLISIHTVFHVYFESIVSNGISYGKQKRECQSWDIFRISRL